MTVYKRRILQMIKSLPNKVDIDELIYRLYLQQKLEAGEADIRQKRLISHDKVLKESMRWFK